MGHALVNLTLFRQQKKMTQRELAEIVGCHKETIGRLERGTLERCKPYLLKELATALGQPESDILKRVMWKAVK